MTPHEWEIDTRKWIRSGGRAYHLGWCGRCGCRAWMLKGRPSFSRDATPESLRDCDASMVQVILSS